MKLLLSSILALFTLACQAQTRNSYSCGDDKLRILLQQIDSAYNTMQRRSNEQLKTHIRNFPANSTVPVFERPVSDDSGFVIPVVVHIVYPAGTPYGNGTNISYAQVRSQIQALNAAFNKNYPSYNGQSHPAYAVSSHIRFCLARNTLDTTTWAVGPGGTEFGVRRYADNTGAFNHFITAASARQLLGITHPSEYASFPFDQYFNIWLVSTIEGGDNVMGYAPRPIMPGYLLDGVVMRADIFGDNTTGSNFNLHFGLTQGKVLAHEVGHYLNLYHIFQDGCAGANAAGSTTDACDLNGDMICDIEPSTTQNIFCGQNIPNTCNANYNAGTTTDDMINDYMSYADDNCMNTFTPDQARRMWATLQLQRPNIWQADNLIATGVLGGDGCIPSYLNAGIKSSNSFFCAGTSITFLNTISGNTATNREWLFPGGIPSSATNSAATVTYAQPGNYKAILKVTDGTNTRTDSLSFTVQECKLDSSMLSFSHWYFGNFCSVDFNAGVPEQTLIALQNRSIQPELAHPNQPFSMIGSTVSLSDSSGNLLFYCNGVSVWNKHHQKITLTPMFGVSDINASTGLCYIPYPGKPGKYFIAGVYPDFDLTPSGVRFVLVDVDSNHVSTFKEFIHPSLPNRFSQFLTVVPHCNGNDYWIIAKGFGTDDTKFYSFLVTASGIDETQTPVVSSGFFQTAFQGSGYQLKSNRLGTQLILTSPAVNTGGQTGSIYDFDSRTGIIANEQKIPDADGYSNIQTGGAFSANGKYFYIFRSSNFATNGLPYWLFQYRVSDMEYDVLTAPGFYFASPMQPGPDGNIYVTTQDNMIARISNTDTWRGASFSSALINVMQPDPEIRTIASIPAFIDARRKTPVNPEFTIGNLTCNSFRFSILCFSNYTCTWNFGDGSLLQTGSTIDHIYAQPGTYAVTVTLSAGAITYGTASKDVTVLPLTANITGPGFVCTNGDYASQYFSTILPEVDYNWTILNGGTLSGPRNLPFANAVWSAANSSGRIKLQVSRTNCTVSDVKTVNIAAGPVFVWLPLPDSVCIYDSMLRLSASPFGGKFEGPGVTDSIFSPSTAGPGNHIITYTYGTETTCLGQTEKMIKVSKCEIISDQNAGCQQMLNTITIAPNPVRDLLTLRSAYVLKYVQVYNSIGQKIAQGSPVGNSISFAALPSGIYTILVFCDQKESYKSFRFMKL
jgi:PKD repeat protein